jgi:hypothetical protein
MIKVIKSNNIRWAGHVAPTDLRNEYKILDRKAEGKYHLGYLGVDGRVILKWALKKYDVRLRIGFIWLRI